MTTAPALRVAPRRYAVARRARGRAGILAWAAVVALGFVWGQLAVADDAGQSLRAAPFAGRWAWHAGWRLAPAAAFGAAVAVVGPHLLSQLRWRRVPVVAGITAAVWTVLLAASDGWSQVGRPLMTRFDYAPFAATIEAPGEFVRSFTDRALEYPIHVKGHPPGATLVFWALDRLGLDGGMWAAALVITGWGVAVASVVLTLGIVAGRPAATRAAPFVALAPGAVWAGSSADGLFAGVVALGVAGLALSTTTNERRGLVLAVGGGSILATALHLTYGAVPLLLVAFAVVVHRRRIDVLLPAAAGGAAVTTAWVLAGFWWFDGLELTRTAYWAGVASRRPWQYHLLAGNPAALAMATGPAVAVAAAQVRRSPACRWLLALAATVAVVVADVSCLSKGEVERIWLPFVPWLATVTTAFPRPSQRRWLLVQVGLGVVLEGWLRSPW